MEPNCWSHHYILSTWLMLFSFYCFSLLFECNNKWSQSGRDCLCLSKLMQSLEFSSLGPVSFTYYYHLASAERRTVYSCQMSSHVLSCFLSDLSHINYTCPWRVWDLVNHKIKMLSRMSYKSGLNYEWSLLRSTVDCCWLSMSRESASKSLSIIFNEFVFKSLKAKCLSSQLTTKRLEIAALCRFDCFRENRFVTWVHKSVSFQHSTATSHAILNQFLVSLPWLEAPPVSFPIAQ